jgi:hypothetical protein
MKAVVFISVLKWNDKAWNEFSLAEESHVANIACQANADCFLNGARIIHHDCFWGHHSQESLLFRSEEMTIGVHVLCQKWAVLKQQLSAVARKVPAHYTLKMKQFPAAKSICVIQQPPTCQIWQQKTFSLPKGKTGPKREALKWHYRHQIWGHQATKRDFISGHTARIQGPA